MISVYAWFKLIYILFLVLAAVKKQKIEGKKTTKTTTRDRINQNTISRWCWNSKYGRTSPPHKKDLWPPLAVLRHHERDKMKGESHTAGQGHCGMEEWHLEMWEITVCEEEGGRRTDWHGGTTCAYEKKTWKRSNPLSRHDWEDPPAG